jgi:hypothetical protein
MPHPAPSRDAPPRSRSPDWQRRHKPSHDGRAPMTPSLHRRAQQSRRTWGGHPNPFSHRRSKRRDGAFMEPSGRNRWQPGANGRAPKAAQIGGSASSGNPRQPFRSDGKEGVDGSSPSEGSAKAPHVGALVQADLLVVERAVGMEAFMKLSRMQLGFERGCLHPHGSVPVCLAIAGREQSFPSQRAIRSLTSDMDRNSSAR